MVLKLWFAGHSNRFKIVLQEGTGHKNYWQQVESYIADHSEVEFTHGFCPECLEKHLKEDLQKAENQSGAGN